MNATYVCEKGPSRSTVHRYEEEIARRWWALPLDIYLPLSNGESCQLLHAGRPGGPLGPDVRDAVLRFTHRRAAATFPGVSSQQAENTVGDVEIHIRASDWFAHQHHTDVRYNNVILHLVLICDDSRPTMRQDGTTILTCSLHDLPSTVQALQPMQWPCHHIMTQMNEEERAGLLMQAGRLRFEAKMQAFLESLQNAQPHGIFSAYDVCLIPALAEGLGYGRDRAFFRAAGLHLIGATNSIPEPLGRAPQPSPLDSSRLRILRNLVAQWRTTGAWETIRQALLETSTKNTLACRGGSGAALGGDACVALGGVSLLPHRSTHQSRTCKKEAVNMPDCFPFADLVRSDAQLRLRSAWIGLNSTAGGTKEPWTRGAILYVTPEIVNGCSTDIIAEGEVAASSRT